MKDIASIKPPVDHDGLEAAVEAAVKAGEHAASKQHDVIENLKDDGSAITEADYECEQLARDSLRATELGHPILGEEYGKSAELGNTYWVIDPIDGTRNYANGFPQYATSIGFVQDGRLEAGAVYEPATETLFAGAHNSGVYVNGEHASVSDHMEADSANYIVTGKWRSRAIGRYTYGQQLPSKLVKYLGCASLALAYQAVGRADAGAVGTLAPWDVAAGICLIREAGGTITGFDGSVDWKTVQKGGFTMDNDTEEVRNAVTEPLERS